MKLTKIKSWITQAGSLHAKALNIDLKKIYEDLIPLIKSQSETTGNAPVGEIDRIARDEVINAQADLRSECSSLKKSLAVALDNQKKDSFALEKELHKLLPHFKDTSPAGYLFILTGIALVGVEIAWIIMESETFISVLINSGKYPDLLDASKVEKFMKVGAIALLPLVGHLAYYSMESIRYAAKVFCGVGGVIAAATICFTLGITHQPEDDVMESPVGVFSVSTGGVDPSSSSDLGQLIYQSCMLLLPMLGTPYFAWGVHALIEAWKANSPNRKAKALTDELHLLRESIGEVEGTLADLAELESEFQTNQDLVANKAKAKLKKFHDEYNS